MKTVLTILILCLSVPLIAQQEADSVRSWKLNPGGNVAYTHLTGGYDLWVQAGVNLELKKADQLVFLPSVNVYKRFGLTGMDAALDSYVFFKKGWYTMAHLRAGWAEFLPGWEWGLTQYKMLGPVELSVGYRQMVFDQPVHLLMASAGYYFGNYWVSYSYFNSRQKQSALQGQSHNLTMRRYLRSSETYIELSGGAGKEVNALAQADQVSVIKQQRLSASYFHPVKGRSLGLGISVMHEQIRTDLDRMRYELKLTFR